MRSNSREVSETSKKSGGRRRYPKGSRGRGAMVWKQGYNARKEHNLAQTEQQSE